MPEVRRAGAFLAAGVALMLAACSEPTAVSSSASREALTPNDRSADVRPLAEHGHVMRTRELNDAKVHDAYWRRASGTGIYYHGGPVLQAGTNVAAVYWASAPIYTNGPAVGTSGPGSSDASLVGYFLNHIGGSAYFNINTTYTDGSGRHIANSVTYTQYWANNSFNVPSGSQVVSDADMIAMLQNGFDTHALTYDPSTLYAIFTAGQVNLGGGFGTQYCAYHSSGTVTIGGVPQTVLYAAMPYNYAYPSACTSGAPVPNADPGADYEVNTLVHETEETTTDMLGTAWYDRSGYENADKCAWTWGTVYSNGVGYFNVVVGSKYFLVQENWVNAGSGGCANSW